MSGITLERSEFLVLMDAAQARAVVGLDTSAILPPDRAAHQALLQQGLELLRQRGLVRVQGDVNVIDPTLYTLAALVAHPQWAVITTRDNPSVGQQLFVHYAAEQAIVEHTLPAEHRHRLAIVPNPTALIERLLDILPLHTEALSTAPAQVPPEVFFSAHKQIKAGQAAAARAALQGYSLAEPGLSAFITALEHPSVGGTLAFLRCEHDEIVDGYNLAVVQGQHSAWLMEAAEDGQLRIESGTAARLQERLTAHVAAFAPRPA